MGQTRIYTTYTTISFSNAFTSVIHALDVLFHVSAGEVRCPVFCAHVSVPLMCSAKGGRLRLSTAVFARAAFLTADDITQHESTCERILLYQLSFMMGFSYCTLGLRPLGNHPSLAYFQRRPLLHPVIAPSVESPYFSLFPDKTSLFWSIWDYLG